MSSSFLTFLRSRPEAGSILIAVLMALIFAITSNGAWLNAGNLQSILQVTSILAIMAFGQMFVVTVGEIDISVGSVFGVSALTYIWMSGIYGIPAAIAIALLVSLIIGLINGVLVNFYNIPSLIATLGTLFAFRGAAYAMTDVATFAVTYEVRDSSAFDFMGGGYILGLNGSVWWSFILLIILSVVLFLTRFGNHLLAVGGQESSALSRGIRTKKLKVFAFLLCSLLAGFAGVLEANHIGFADGSFGRLMELEAVAATVLGGCLLLGGRSSVIGTFFGAFILSSIQSYLVVMGIQPQWFMLLLGGIVVLASLSNNKLTSFVRAS